MRVLKRKCQLRNDYSAIPRIFLFFSPPTPHNEFCLQANVVCCNCDRVCMGWLVGMGLIHYDCVYLHWLSMDCWIWGDECMCDFSLWMTPSAHGQDFQSVHVFLKKIATDSNYRTPMCPATLMFCISSDSRQIRPSTLHCSACFSTVCVTVNEIPDRPSHRHCVN